MITPTIPTTKNEEWGFYGAMREHAETAWKIALPEIAKATATEFDAVRLFLDSRHGRHFADDVQSRMLGGLGLEPAIHATIHRWMAWKIGCLTSKNYGIPQGLPYLTGWVVHGDVTGEIS